MKFLADMGVSPRVVEHLRLMGHDAVHLHEHGCHLDDILAQHLPALESGAILSVTERRVRLRMLPIQTKAP